LVEIHVVVGFVEMPGITDQLTEPAEIRGPEETVRLAVMVAGADCKFSTPAGMTGVTVTVAEYVPGARPAGFGTSDKVAGAVPVAGVTVSHCPPETEAVNGKSPPICTCSGAGWGDPIAQLQDALLVETIGWNGGRALVDPRANKYILVGFGGNLSCDTTKAIRMGADAAISSSLPSWGS
jgi:hypothetical protein